MKLSVKFGLLALIASLMPSLAQADTIRIGVQKYGTLIILRDQHVLEDRFKAQGISVEWKEFPGGPQLLEALAVGSVDLGTTGDAPPVFAQAAGAPLVYVGVEPAAPQNEAILVPKDSPIQSLAGLKGKRVALNKGSNVHFLLVQALISAGLGPQDIQSIFLTPSDARAAFERGSVDAWAIWDPFLSAAEAAGTTRRLTDGTGLTGNRQYYLAERSFADHHAALVHDILDAIAKTDAWAKTHQSEVAVRLSGTTGLPVPVLAHSLAGLGYGVEPLDEATITGQQQIADTFFRLNLIPKPLTVRDIVWSPHS